MSLYITYMYVSTSKSVECAMCFDAEWKGLRLPPAFAMKRKILCLGQPAKELQYWILLDCEHML